MKAYWWWPWSSKVSEVVLSESQKERAEKYSSYSFLYRVMLLLFTSVLTHRLVSFFQHKFSNRFNRSNNMPGSNDNKTVAIPQL
jgi:hypothetical protein